MFSLFENLIAARRRPEEGAWIQFVVIAVFIAFSIIKTILGAKSAAPKRKSEQGDSSSKPRPVPKRYLSDNGYKTIEQIRDERKAQIRAAFGIPTPPHEKKLVSEPLPAPRRPVKKIEKPVHHTKTTRDHSEFFDSLDYARDRSAPAFATATSGRQDSPVNPNIYKAQTDKKQPHTSASAQTATGDVYKLLFSSPQNVRNAIIYYEILGKPLALREM